MSHFRFRFKLHVKVMDSTGVGPRFHTWNLALNCHRAIPVDVKTSSSSIKDQVGTAKKDEVKEDLLQIRSGPRSPGSLAARGEIRGGGS
ncbi:unnamed protein product [Microthlaspi erraticum]|uniref:Uncharacterized protein n=1 Tax=Microthlaspi erraticum TaxID=1685480 RepID=A0A6D2JKE2_9BRAS|nr:unnamed protein product [Microthlaspi erraticum]